MRTVDLLEQIWDIFIVERQSAAQHDVKDNPATPDVNFRSSILSAEGLPEPTMSHHLRTDSLSTNDLWGGVIRASARRFQE